jgi:hypothetical protein
LIDSSCLCTAIYRVSPNYLLWAVEKWIEGRVVNRIQVRADPGSRQRETLGPRGA